jgi:hypothetical protein
VDNAGHARSGRHHRRDVHRPRDVLAAMTDENAYTSHETTPKHAVAKATG